MGILGRNGIVLIGIVCATMLAVITSSEATVNSDSSFARLAGLYNNLGITQALNGHFDLAMESLDSARQLIGDESDLLNNVGNVLLCQGRFSEAIDAYRNALQIDSLNRNKLFNWGLALYLSGAVDEAENIMGEFLQHYSDSTEDISWLPGENLLKGETQAATSTEIKRLMTKARKKMKLALDRKNRVRDSITSDSSLVRNNGDSADSRRTVPAGGKAIESKDISPLLYWIFK